MMRARNAVLSTALLLSVTGFAGAETLKPTDDTFTNLASPSAKSGGVAVDLAVGNTAATGVKHTFVRFNDSSLPVGSSENGELAVTVPPVSAILLRPDRAIAALPAATPGLRVEPDDLSSYIRLSVPVADPTVTVTFAAKRGSGAWQRVASDDSPPYRGFLDPARFKRKEKVQVVAIERALEGSVAISRVATVVPRQS